MGTRFNLKSLKKLEMQFPRKPEGGGLDQGLLRRDKLLRDSLCWFRAHALSRNEIQLCVVYEKPTLKTHRLKVTRQRKTHLANKYNRYISYFTDQREHARLYTFDTQQTGLQRKGSHQGQRRTLYNVKGVNILRRRKHP